MKTITRKQADEALKEKDNETEDNEEQEEKEQKETKPTQKNKKYTREGFKELEKEIEEEEKKLKESQQEPSKSDEDDKEDDQDKEDQEDDEDLGYEEKTFKKRYSDLRRFHEKKLKEAQEEINKLKDVTDQQQNVLPASEEELDKFKEENPDLFKVVRSIFLKDSEDLLQEINKREQTVDEALKEMSLKDARLKLESKHPDVDSLLNSKEFSKWMESRTDRRRKEIDSILFEEDDVDEMVAVLDEFKQLTGYGQKQDSSAAEDVDVKNPNPDVSTQKEKVWTESEVNKLSLKEFEKHREEIDLAIKEGRFKFGQ